MTCLDEILAAALDLARAGRWERALRLLDAAGPDDPRVARTAAEVALEGDWFAGTALAASRLATADRIGGPSWDLDFLRLRHDYRLLLNDRNPQAPTALANQAAAIADRAAALADRAPDGGRHGWARMYLGLILDNLVGDRAAAPAHYRVALTAGDDLLSWEALRHLGDHDRDHDDRDAARERWERATALGARAGLVCGTLSQQMLLAVLARDGGDEPGAVRLATEVGRWAGAIGASRLRDQAAAFLAGERVA